MDGLVLRGRLVKVIEPRVYKKKDGTDGESYPGLVVLAGDETVKVEYRSVELRDDALLVGCAALGDVAPDGMVPSLPACELVVRALGVWDAEARSFAPTRYVGP